MREILFKAKRIDNGEWAQGAVLFHDTDATTIFNQHMGDGSLQGFEVNPSTICQYTGLKDKNGNKIWENDIFQYTDGTMVTQKDLIEYNETHASFVRLRNTEKLGLQYLWIDEATCNHGEVIGNIFDNKELLQEEHK